MAIVEQVDPQAVTQEDQPQADPAQVQQVVSTVGDGLMLIRESMENVPGILPENKQELDGILEAYMNFVKNTLGSAPGEGPQIQEGQAPQETGAAAVQPVI